MKNSLGAFLQIVLYFPEEKVAKISDNDDDMILDSDSGSLTVEKELPALTVKSTNSNTSDRAVFSTWDLDNIQLFEELPPPLDLLGMYIIVPLYNIKLKLSWPQISLAVILRLVITVIFGHLTSLVIFLS